MYVAAGGRGVVGRYGVPAAASAVFAEAKLNLRKMPCITCISLHAVGPGEGGLAKVDVAGLHIRHAHPDQQPSPSPALGRRSRAAEIKSARPRDGLLQVDRQGERRVDL